MTSRAWGRVIVKVEAGNTLERQFDPSPGALRRTGVRAWLVRLPRAVPLMIFLLTSAVTAMSVYAIEWSEAQKERASLNQAIDAIGSALERRSETSSAYLRAGAILLGAQDVIRVSDFRNFVSELQLNNDNGWADGIGWAPVVTHADIDAFERSMADEVLGGIHIHPALAPDRSYAVPVTYLHPPSARNRRALGFDMASEPVRRAAMSAAAEAGVPTASGKVVLKQEGDQPAPGFLIYMPVFRENGADRDLRGYIYSPFNAGQYLSSALQLEPVSGFGVRLYDRKIEPSALLAERSPDDLRGERCSMVSNRDVTIANRKWILQVCAPHSGALTNMSLLTLIFGLLIASLLMVVARLVTQQALEDQQAFAWLKQQISIRNSLTRELNHRVKNTLANVLSIVALTRRRAEDVDSFAEGLDGRIRALSATHDLLTQSDWSTTPVRAVIDVELAPYAKEGEHKLDLSGPDVELAPNDALSLGLAVHELATNAAKYGALSQPGGVVSVAWHLLSKDLAQIEWVESGGPRVEGKIHRGFGTDLIEKIVAHELGNPVDLRFDEAGVRCTLSVPVRAPAPFSIRTARS